MGAGVGTTKLVDLSVEQIHCYTEQSPGMSSYSALILKNKVDGSMISLLKEEGIQAFLNDLGMTNSVHRTTLASDLINIIAHQKNVTDSNSVCDEFDISCVNKEFESWSPANVSAFIETIHDDFKDYRNAIIEADLNGAKLSLFKNEEEIQQMLSTLPCTINNFNRIIIAENIFGEMIRSPNQHAPAADADAPKKTYPFPKLGINLKGLREFVEKCGGKDALRGLTTSEVNANYQKLMTFSKKLSYCDLLAREGSIYVGEARAFASHAWNYKFLDAIDALEQAFKDEPDLYIWFDNFSQNQHIALDLDFTWWRDTFRDAINKIQHTVLILAPWSDPIPFTRIWCLWEIFVSSTSGTVLFKLVMSQSEKDSFMETLLNDYDAVDKMLATVDVRRSDAFIPEDKTRILAAIEASVGIDGINKVVLEKLRDSVTRMALEGLTSSAGDEVREASIGTALGRLYMDQSMYAEAENYLRKSWFTRKVILPEGEKHADTLWSMMWLGCVLWYRGEYSEAERLLRECLSVCIVTLGDKHDTSLRTMNSLAGVYNRQGKYSEAEMLHTQCLARKLEVLGPSHASSLRSMNNLANVYSSQGKYSEAIKLHEKCLSIRQEALGLRHADTLASMNNLANAYGSQDKFSKSEKLYKQGIALRQEVLGPRHADTLGSMNNLAGISADHGKYLEAEELYKQCFALQQEVLGPRHADTLLTLGNLASVYDENGKHSEAEELYKQCLLIRQEVLGLRHANTLSTYNLGLLFWDQNKYSDSEFYFYQCYLGRVEIFGETHTDTKDAKRMLLKVYKKLGKSL